MAGAVTKAGRYQILGELGRGSMGVVYRGFDPIIGRTVAIKTMLTEGLPPGEFEEFKARFQREAQAAGVLGHPNIVTVYDFGEDQGILYLAMEFLEGKSLQKLVEEQNVLPIETIIPIYEQVSSALDRAHEHKIVHRDIKPANIMILASGLVKVTDFGIAKMMSLGMTQAGQILGTPNYMSPEQVKGRPVDGRSDIFSLGVILYELVTGEKPFGGQNITTVIYKIMNENPIPPRELDATIHPGLSYVIGKALAKNPDERYQTCRELIEDLRNYKNLGGTTGPGATVVMKVPPIQAAPAEPVAPPPPVQHPRLHPTPPAPKSAPPQAPAEPQRQARPLSVQVIPPVKAQPQKSSSVVWVLLTLLLVGGLGGGYYQFVYKPGQAGPKPPSFLNGALTVTADIEGAKITIDGRSDPSWVTPHTFQDLIWGPHVVVISKEGHNDVQQSVNIEGGQTKYIEAKFNTSLSTVAQLEVKANVEGAKIAIDDRTDPEWVTPHTFPDLPPGPHVLAVSKEGYKGWQQSVTVEGGRTTSISAELSTLERAQPPPPTRNLPKFGQLVITANIQGAKIAIDGRSDPDWITPHTFPELPAGPHAVVISKEGYDDVRRTATVEGGRTTPINVELTVPSGEINIVTNPAGAEVMIDGQPMGTSPVRATVRVGKHTYTAKLAGMAPAEGNFTMQDGAILKRTVSWSSGATSATGIVAVRTIPPGATVYADGTALGQTPTSFKLTAGRHTVTISMSGFRPLRKEIDVPADGSIPINETLSPQ